MSVEEMLPALAQGAVGLETRAGDDVIRDLVAAVNDQATAVTVAAERGFLAALDGSCRTRDCRACGDRGRAGAGSAARR